MRNKTTEKNDKKNQLSLFFNTENVQYYEILTWLEMGVFNNKSLALLLSAV